MRTEGQGQLTASRLDGRMDTASVVAFGAAVGLILSLWFDWYTVEYVVPRTTLGTTSVTAWEVFSVVDVALLCLGVAAIGCLAVGWRLPALGISVAVLVLVVYHMIDTPGGTVLKDYRQDVGLDFGIWLALTSAIALCIGCGLALKEEVSR